MATKKELEDRIAQLEADVRERDKAIDILSRKDGMEITLPACPMDVATGDAPHLKYKGGIMESLITVMEPSLRKHGAKLSRSSAAKTLLLHENFHRVRGDAILVPAVWGEIMVDIMDAAAKFGRQCYEAGVSHGSSLLTRLSQNEITPGQFEEGIDSARRRQERKDIRNLIQDEA